LASSKFIERGRDREEILEVRVDAATSRTNPASLSQHFQRVRPFAIPSRDVQCSEVAASVLVRTLDDGVPRKGAIMESRGRSGLGNKLPFKHVGQVHFKFLWGTIIYFPPLW